MEKQIATAATLVLCTLLAACTTAPQRELSHEVPTGAYLATGAVPFDPASADAFAETGGLMGQLEQRHGRPLQVLELSGGGQYGAFGAGFLDGWTRSGTRPEFDVVTGISTGALLATHAFLGTPADDAVLAEIFNNVTQEDIYREGGVMRLLSGASSLMDTTPLKALIAKHITPAVLERVAAEYDRGRSLFVATTNLDHQQVWVFDLGEIARDGGAEALSLYHSAVLASASPPIAFPPVEIAGSLFADGATRENLLVVGLTGPGSDIAKAPGAAPGTIYVLHNGRLTEEPSAMREDVAHIVGRTLRTTLDGRMSTTLIRAFLASRIHGYDFAMVSIPDGVEVSGKPLAFDREEMRRVYEAGRTLALSSDPWQRTPPASDDTGPWVLKLLDEVDRLR